jgi:hypothetical protein
VNELSIVLFFIEKKTNADESGLDEKKAIRRQVSAPSFFDEPSPLLVTDGFPFN